MAEGSNARALDKLLGPISNAVHVVALLDGRQLVLNASPGSTIASLARSLADRAELRWTTDIRARVECVTKTQSRGAVSVAHRNYSRALIRELGRLRDAPPPPARSPAASPVRRRPERSSPALPGGLATFPDLGAFPSARSALNGSPSVPRYPLSPGDARLPSWSGSSGASLSGASLEVAAAGRVSAGTGRAQQQRHQQQQQSIHAQRQQQRLLHSPWRTAAVEVGAASVRTDCDCFQDCDCIWCADASSAAPAARARPRRHTLHSSCVARSLQTFSLRGQTLAGIARADSKASLASLEAVRGRLGRRAVSVRPPSPESHSRELLDTVAAHSRASSPRASLASPSATSFSSRTIIRVIPPEPQSGRAGRWGDQGSFDEDFASSELSSACNLHDYV